MMVMINQLVTYYFFPNTQSPIEPEAEPVFYNNEFY